jgi:hypothetical protein
MLATRFKSAFSNDMESIRITSTLCVDPVIEESSEQIGIKSFHRII